MDESDQKQRSATGAEEPPPPFHPSRSLLFLDFDGVLVDLAPAPDGISVPSTLPSLLTSLYHDCGGAVFLVSGREIADLRRHLGPLPLTAYGCHGAEIGEGEAAVRPLATVDAATVVQMIAGLKAAAAPHPAMLVEEKPSGVVLHYRRDPALSDRARDIAERVVAKAEGFHMHQAKMAFELRPDGVSKLDVVQRLIDLPEYRGRCPVYLGDDTTDEPALDHVRRVGGISVKVGEGETAAQYRLATPGQVASWLREGISG